MRFCSGFLALAAGLLCGFERHAVADQVSLKDGSVLVGTVQGLTNGTLKLTTSFAADLPIPWAQVAGLATENPVDVEMASGARMSGRLDATDGQQFLHGAAGDAALVLAEIGGIWPVGQEPALGPAAATGETTPEAVPAPPASVPLWTGRAELGVNGQSGNKERIDVRGGVDLNRKTEQRRLNLYLKGQYAETDSARTANEVMGGTRLEVDFSERTYVFGKLDLEQDEFEDLELRATLTAGLGHFFVKREKLELKGWVGAGYEHETFDRDPEPQPEPATLEEAIRQAILRRLRDFDTTVSMDEAVVEAGYTYQQDWKKNFRFKHGLTYYPSITGPGSEYRLAADTGLEFPLGKEPDWTLRTGVRHEFDSQPQEGIDELDTTYYVNLGYNW